MAINQGIEFISNEGNYLLAITLEIISQTDGREKWKFKLSFQLCMFYDVGLFMGERYLSLLLN